MKKEIVERFVKDGQLRPRGIDVERIKSMLKSSEMTAKAALEIQLDENRATMVFRELYESTRQLGDVLWWLEGYEPRNHEVSLEILEEVKIKNAVLLNKLPRFKKIRNDANYRGYIVPINQAEEIKEFWKNCGKEIVDNIMSRLR